MAELPQADISSELNHLQGLSKSRLILLILRCARRLQPFYNSISNTKPEQESYQSYLKEFESLLRYIELHLKNSDEIDKYDTRMLNMGVKLYNMAVKLKADSAVTAACLASDALDTVCEDATLDSVLEFAKRAVESVVRYDSKIIKYIAKDIETLKQFSKVHLIDLQALWPEGEPRTLKEQSENLVHEKNNNNLMDYGFTTNITKKEPDSFKYDVAFSYASQDKNYVARVAAVLQDANVRAFYDSFEPGSLTETNIYTFSQQVYGEMSRYIIIFYSSHYRDKHWPVYELQCSTKHAQEKEMENIILVNLDGTRVPHIKGIVTDFNSTRTSPEAFAKYFLEYFQE